MTRKWTFKRECVLFRTGDEEGNLFVIMPDQIVDCLDDWVGCSFPIIKHNGDEGRARLKPDHSVAIL